MTERTRLPIGSGFIEVVVSAFLPPGMIVMKADLTDDEKRAVMVAALRHEADGMSPLQARALALAETGKVAVLHCARDLMPEVKP